MPIQEPQKWQMEASMNIRMALQLFVGDLYLISPSMRCMACELIICLITLKCKSLINNATIMVYCMVVLIILEIIST